MATPLTFGNHLKFFQDSCHTSKGRPTFLPWERVYPKLHTNHTDYLEGPLMVPTRVGASPRQVVKRRPNSDFPTVRIPSVDITLQLLLVPRNGIDVSRRNNAFRHPMAWPSLTNPAQDPIGKHRSMEGTFIMRSSLTLSKLPWDTTSGVVWAATKSN